MAVSIELVSIGDSGLTPLLFFIDWVINPPVAPAAFIKDPESLHPDAFFHPQIRCFVPHHTDKNALHKLRCPNDWCRNGKTHDCVCVCVCVQVVRTTVDMTVDHSKHAVL